MWGQLSVRQRLSVWGGIVLLDAEVDVYDRRLIRASRGHLFSLPHSSGRRRTTFLPFCEQHDLTTARYQTPTPPAQFDALAGFQGRLAIAFGNEKKGYSKALLEAAAFQVKIPMDPPVESLKRLCGGSDHSVSAGVG